MPVFQLKARTAETYLAGIGASGALMASAFVMFVILVGVVTFDAWPHTGALFGGGDGDVSLNSTTASPAAAAVANTPNLAKLLSSKAPPVTAQAASPSHRVSHPSVISQGRLESGTNNSLGGSGGQAPVGTPEPPPPVTGGPSNVVNRTVSTVGNTVEGTTTIVGDNLGGTSGSGLGGVVGNLGKTVNGALQGLVGNH